MATDLTVTLSSVSRHAWEMRILSNTLSCMRGGDWRREMPVDVHYHFEDEGDRLVLVESYKWNWTAELSVNR